MAEIPADTSRLTVGERIRLLRTRRSLSQRDLSCPGVTYAYISRIEADERKPSVTAIRKIAGKLSVTPYYLEHGQEDPAILLATQVLNGADKGEMAKLARKVLKAHS